MPRLRDDVLHQVAEIASVQRGLVSADQLAEAGLARSSVRHRARQGGPWRRVLPATYLVSSGPLDDHQRRTAALLYVGAPAALTGLTALRRWGVRSALREPSELVHVLIPHTRTRLSAEFVLVERTRHWPTIETVDGEPLVGPARAAIDACRQLSSRSAVRGLLSEVTQTRLVTLTDLRAELLHSQRRRSALARETLELLARGPASAAELQLYDLWTASGLPEAAWNPDLLAMTGALVARPDVYVEESGVVVEVDSREFHSGPDDWERTMRRHSRLTALGFVVLHYSPARIREDWVEVAREIWAAIDRPGARPVDGVRIRPTDAT